MRKRGQAAAFIIIGLIVLIAVISILAIRSGTLSNLFQSITTERAAVPEQLKPLQSYLDSCVTQITKDGVNLAALQGGVINLKEDNVPTTTFTPLGRSLDIMPGSDFKTSVWFREKGNGIQELNVPSKTDIENDLSSYIENNFASCIFNLTSFEDQGYITSAKGEPKATVTLGDGKISSVVNFPINVKIGDTNFTLTDHRADIDSNFGKLYNMAKEILDSENQGYFLENKTLDTLVAYDEEVPFTGTDLSCKEKVWLKSEVIRKLKNILFENVASMHIKGTDYQLRDDNSKYLEFDALKSTDNSVSVNLMYIPDWPTDVEISPSEGNVLRSEQISKGVGGPASTIMSTFFCLSHHRFIYNIKYPVLITLRDSNGLTFQYATEVIIDNNEPRQNRQEILNAPDVQSIICKYPQKDVTIFTGTLSPAGDLVPLENVSLSFKCFPATCPLGISTPNDKGEPSIVTKVPACFNGIIQGYKEGYKQVQKTIFSSNQQDTPQVALVQLEPIYTKKVNVFVIEKDTGKVRDPYDTEQINFQFVHKGTNYQTSYIYPSQDNTMQLVAGDYIMNSYILRNSSTYNITIPKQSIENCVDTRDLSLLGFFKTNKVCQTTETDALSFDTILTGGATNVEHTFKREDLAKDAPLNLYVLTSQIPSSLDDLQKVQIQIDTNKDNPLFREPNIE